MVIPLPEILTYTKCMLVKSRLTPHIFFISGTPITWRIHTNFHAFT